MKRKLLIGVGQANRICQLPNQKRLEFLAEGLPIILDSAQSLWRGSRKLKKKMPREASVLRGLAEEEAAKALILVDAARCPSHRIAYRIGAIMQWFNNHLARLIYAEATKWRYVDVAELRMYVNSNREAYFREGPSGEYIFPNWHIYNRESVLYADIQTWEDGDLRWSAPAKSLLGSGVASRYELPPFSIHLAEAMSALGIFTPRGLKVTSKIWGEVEFIDKEGPEEKAALIDSLVIRLIEEGLTGKEETNEHINTLEKHWQLPMYNLEFGMLNETGKDLKELQAARDAELLQEII